MRERASANDAAREPKRSLTRAKTQATLTHVMRQTLPEHLDSPMERAAAQQHGVLRRMWNIPEELLPDSLAAAAAVPHATVYRFHLTTDLGGCAIPHPQLVYLLAHAGGAASTFPVLAVSSIVGHLFDDPTTWRTSRVRHLRRVAETCEYLFGLPAFYTPPALHPERSLAFANAIKGPDGKPTMAKFGELHRRHPQSNFTKIFNRQLYDDLTHDLSSIDDGARNDRRRHARGERLQRRQVARTAHHWQGHGAADHRHAR